MTWSARTPPPPAWATGGPDYAFTGEFTADFDAPHTAADWSGHSGPPPSWGQGTGPPSTWTNQTPPPPSWATE